jgi:hypothetical protein
MELQRGCIVARAACHRCWQLLILAHAQLSTEETFGFQVGWGCLEGVFGVVEVDG